VGYAHNRKALRTFAVDRVLGVTVEPDRFEMPEEYRPSERLSDAFGIVSEEPMAVRVRFSPRVAHAVKGRLWHPSQKMEESPDGTLELSFTAGGKMEILAWILSYGEHAEVLAPEGLRTAVAEVVGKMQGIYSKELSS
jgi:proteasome accessory factor B